MEFAVTIDGVQKTVALGRDAEGYTVSVDGKEYHIADVSSTEGTIAFLLERDSYLAHVSDGEGGVRISIRGRNYLLIEEEMDADRPGAAAGGDGRLEAPMPGNIVAVRASEGDAVKAGQPIVVLESMKMQNEIASPIDGTVARVHCQVGDQVGYGEVLAEIAPPERDE